MTMDTGQGSLEAIPRVAPGSYQIGAADINSPITFRDRNPGLTITAIVMICNKPAFPIVGRKSLAIGTPGDRKGKVPGAPAPTAPVPGERPS